MILITYNINKNVDADEYEEWLRDVDNPFFNSVPGVVRYANWKVVEEKLGSTNFSYYDLMEIEDLDGFEKVWGSDEVRKFAQAWIDRWSVYGPDEKYAALNLQVLLCQEIAAPD